MSIDEAIAQEKFKARVDRIKANKRIFHNNDEDEISACHRSAEEHDQIAEWLEELKSYRASVFSGDITQKMLKEEYCKAVDDFAESVKNLIADSSVIRFKDIDEIAEQLKVGGENEQSI